MFFKKIYAYGFLMACMVATPAFAQDDAAQTPAQNPYIEDIKAKANELTETFSEKQANDLMQLRNAHGMIESIYMVQGNVANAQGLCISQYPEMTDFLEQSLQTWEKNVIPVVTEKSDILYANINDDRFPDADAVRGYLELIDKAAEYADSQLVKEPVVTQDTCRALGKSLRNTSAELVGMLHSIEWPDDVIKPSDAPLTEKDVPLRDMDGDPLTDSETYPADRSVSEPEVTAPAEDDDTAAQEQTQAEPAQNAAPETEADTEADTMPEQDATEETSGDVQDMDDMDNAAAEDSAEEEQTISLDDIVPQNAETDTQDADDAASENADNDNAENMVEEDIVEDVVEEQISPEDIPSRSAEINRAQDNMDMGTAQSMEQLEKEALESGNTAQ